MDILNFEALLIAISIFTLTPGLDNALVLRNTSRSGLKDVCKTSLVIIFVLFVNDFLYCVFI
ncbi:LysE family translocator, partial [Vibrio parahaemolyticus]|nr:LysE family translocator [Vibrio parahaemolyticus]